RRRLIEGIAKRTHFAFETTLGGNSMTHTLLDAIAAGVSVNVWYCGLESVELHIQRVAERVARGGHDIPEELIRRRYRSSMRNLCRLTPGLRQLAVFDNSRPLDGNGKPKLRNLLHVRDGDLLALANTMPSWAKPVAAVCVRSAR
ncbi:MAG: ZTL protein, partial [Pseudomonadota bacterium]